MHPQDLLPVQGTRPAGELMPDNQALSGSGPANLPAARRPVLSQ